MSPAKISRGHINLFRAVPRTSSSASVFPLIPTFPVGPRTFTAVTMGQIPLGTVPCTKVALGAFRLTPQPSLVDIRGADLPGGRGQNSMFARNPVSAESLHRAACRRFGYRKAHQGICGFKAFRVGSPPMHCFWESYCPFL